MTAKRRKQVLPPGEPHLIPLSPRVAEGVAMWLFFAVATVMVLVVLAVAVMGLV